MGARGGSFAWPTEGGHAGLGRQDLRHQCRGCCRFGSGLRKLETEGLPPLGEHVVTGEGAKKWRINAMRSLRERAPDSHDRGACAQANLN